MSKALAKCKGSDRLAELYSWVLHYENEIELLQAEIVIVEAELNGEA